ncbi:MAG: hypothetical protein NTZ98_25185 [Acidobacteria bacterium]|jgi:hypothetical protein|nr:hypothetical protein [Acidobacteriota bacterium]
MKRAALVFLVVLALAALAAAQTKFSGAGQCGKVEKEYKIEVGDRPGHAFTIAQGKCTYTKGEIAGIQVKEEVWTGSGELSGNTIRVRFSSFLALTNGEKAYVRGDGTTTLKDGVPQTEEGKWTYAGGAGKLKGLKGKGTYKVKYAADGTSTFEAEGEYELPK